MEQILILFKIDLGISHTLRDDFFTKLLAAAKLEIEGKGINIDLLDVEDQMLLSDYAAWKYRKRQEDTGLPRNIQLRIRNRVVKERAKYAST